MDKIVKDGKEYADCIHVRGKGNFSFKARLSILFSLNFTATTEVYCENLPGSTDSTPIGVSSYDITDWFKNLFRDKRGLMATSERVDRIVGSIERGTFPDNAKMITPLTQLKSPWWAKCAMCGQIYKDHAGSTECCGSIAYLVDEKGNDIINQPPKHIPPQNPHLFQMLLKK